jgi:serine/threonine protein kinase
MKPTARRRLGKYVLLGRLGAGGMGKIYLAHAPGPAGIEKLLVVKRLHGHLTGDPVLVTSFLDEARLAMALNHPHIVHTYDVGEVDGRYFMVMEYIDGQNLGVLLRTAKRSGQYPVSSLWAGLFCAVLDGLHAAHVARDARGRPLQIIHRDVSPQNVLVTYDGVPKLVDFGIAKAAMRVGETDAGTLKGKYAYMSPEQVRGEPLDPRSDVFAAGVVLWEMLAGRRLYKADTIVRSVERILQEEPVSPRRINGDVDERLARVCTKALAKERERRFSSAEAMKEALEDALSAMGHRHRSADVRALMQRLFADVIARQRAVLESSLNAADAGEEGDEDESRAPRSAGDSQSDLRMPQLRVVAAADRESTTPSALQRSPLVTVEAPARTDRPSSPRAPPVVEADTAVGRPRPPTRPALPVPPLPPLPPLPPPSAVPLSSAGPSTPRRPDRNAVVEPSAAVTATQPAALAAQEQSPPNHRRWWLLLVALGGGVAAAVGAVVALVPVGTAGPAARGPGGGGHAAVATDVAAAADAGLQPVAGDGGPVIDVPDAGGPGAIVAAGAVDGGAVDGGAVDGGVIDVVEDDDDPDDSDDAAAAGALTIPRPVRPSPPPRRPPKRFPPPRPVAVDEGDDASSSAAEGTGFLTLDTVPWTTVYLGSRKLGETPLVKVPVPAGEVELQLVNPEQKIDERYVARVKPGAVFRTRLDLR